MFSSCKPSNLEQTGVTELFQPAPIDSFVYYPIKDSRIIVDLNNPQEVSFYDYFSHIELIPLETNNDVLVGFVNEIIHYHGRYYVFDKQQKMVIIFDEMGKFIFQINKRGRGPGEYIEIKDIFLNPFTECIDILDIGAVHSYDLSGKHVKTTRLINQDSPSSSLLQYPCSFIALNEKTYVFYSSIPQRSNSFPYKIDYYDIEKANVFHREYEVDNYLNTYWVAETMSPTRFYEYNGKFFFSYLVDNVTYEVGQESLIKAYTWDFGRHNYDARNLNVVPGVKKILPYRIRFQGQNNRYVIACIHLQDDSDALLIYDKYTNECKFTKSIYVRLRHVSNEYVLFWVPHEWLKYLVSEEMLDETNRQIFKNLMNAKEEQNPIVIKYYFK